MKSCGQAVKIKRRPAKKSSLTKGELALSHLRGKGILRESTDKILESTRGCRNEKSTDR